MKHEALPHSEMLIRAFSAKQYRVTPSKLRIWINLVSSSLTHHRQHFCASSTHFILQRTALAATSSIIAYVAIATGATVC